MKVLRVVAVILFLTTDVYAQSPVPTTDPARKGCLIVKHKGTLGRRLLWTALIGLPTAPGAKYDLVDSARLPAVKMAYRGKELEELQAQGVRVVVLQAKYSPQELDAARKSCETSAAK